MTKDISKILNEEAGIKINGNSSYIREYAMIRDEYALILERLDKTYTLNFYINGNWAVNCGRFEKPMTAFGAIDKKQKLENIFQYFEEEVVFNGWAGDQILKKFKEVFHG